MGSNTLLVVFGVLGIAAGLFFIWLGFTMQKQAAEVREHGLTAQAEITARRTVRHVRRGNVASSLYVTFRFNGVGADGKTASYTQEQEVGASSYASLTEGSKTQVVYLPRNPGGTAALASGDNRAISGSYTLGGGCLVGALILLIAAFGTVSATTGQANATQTSVATLSGEVATVRAAIEPHLAAWKETADQNAHSVSPAELGLSSVTQESIVYGYCTPQTFYVFVPQKFQEGRTPDVHYSDAYGYTSQPDDFCWPKGWLMTKKGDLGAGWFLALVVVTDATPTPGPK